MSTTIDSLNIRIEASAGNAAYQIQRLATELGKLKENSKVTTTVNGLKRLHDALDSLNNINLAKLNSLRGTLIGLGNLQKLSGLNSAITTLKKLPDIFNSLDDAMLAKFTLQMERLANALKPLATEINKVAAGFAKLPSQVSKAVTATNKMGAAAKNMGQGVNEGNLNLMTFLSNVEQIWGYAQVLIQKLSNVISTAIEWDGIQYRFGRAFGEDAEEVYAHVQRINEVMGISIQEFMQYSSLYGSLLSGFGMSQDKVTTISVGLTELSYDIWAAYNDRFKSLEQASEAVRSAITGEIEPIRNAGIALTEASIQEYLDNIGMATVSIEKLSEAQKAEVRYAAMMNAAMQQGIVGTYAKEMHTAEGAVRSLSQSLKTLYQAFGSLFIPILQIVVPYLTAFVELLTEAAHWVAALFGIELFKIDWSSSGSGMSGLADSATDTAAGLESAAGAAKKLKNYTMGFDELNVIQPQSDSGSGGAGGGGSGDAGWGEGLLGLDTLWDDSVFAEATQRIEGLKEELRGYWDEWKEEIIFIGGLLSAWSIAGMIGQMGKLLGLGDEFFGVLNGIKQAAAVGILLTIQYSLQSEFFENFIETGEWESYIWAAVTGALGAFGSYLIWGKKGLVLSLAITAVTSLSATFEDGSVDSTEELVTGLTGAATGIAAIAGAIKLIKLTDLGAFFALLGEGYSIGAALSAWFPGIASALTAVGTAVSGVLSGIAAALGISVGWVVAIIAAIIAAIVAVIVYWDEIKLFFTDILPVLWDKFVDWLGNIAGAVGEWFSRAAEDIGEWFSKCWDGVVSIWNKAADWFNDKVVQPIIDFFAPIVDWFAEWFGNIWDTVSDVFYNIGVIAKGCWQIIEAVWKIVSDWFDKKVVQPISEFFSKLWTKVEDLALSAWNGIKSAFSAISGWINDKVIKPVSDFFSKMWSGFLEKAKSAWAAVKSVFSKVGQFFGDTFRAAWEKVVKVFSVAGEIFVDIKDAVLSSFKKIVNALITGINKVVALPFKGINATLSLIRDIEILELKPFANIKTISVPEIPLLASGGMVGTGQMFIAREAGPELVGRIGNRTAVANNDQIVAAVSQGVYSAVRAAMGGEGGSGQSVNVYLDGKQIYTSVRKIESERGVRLMGSQLGYAY